MQVHSKKLQRRSLVKEHNATFNIAPQINEIVHIFFSIHNIPPSVQD